MKFLNRSAGLTGVVGLLLWALLSAACETTEASCDATSADPTAACQSLQCSGTMADCQNGATDGCETNTATDVNNCGACGIKCPAPSNGEAACVDGACGVSACGTRYKDCNGSATDGCEIDSYRDVNNCGGCGTVCSGGTNAVGVCIQGKCQLACQASYLDCNGDASDGCETNGAADSANCGNCGNTCSPVGATNVACSAGSCTSTACSGTNRTCKAGPIDSCEINTATNVTNCGACGKVCAAVQNGTPGCVNSNCAIASCSTGFADCDKALGNGCEIDTTSNVSHCSACGMACPALANATPACATSMCKIGSCNAGFADCDKALANGCEINTTNDVKNCGACGKACATGEFCISGTCTSVPPTCRMVAGIRWCYNQNACGQACNDVCASLGLPFTISDATWFAAQDTAAECQAINDAFALGGAVSMSSYTYACSEDQGAVHAVPGGLVGPLLCSTYGPCPTNHRTMMDQLGIACNMSSRRSVCPCQ